MRVALLLLAVASVGIQVPPAHAEADTQTFLHTYDTSAQAGRRLLENTLAWDENGMSWANADLAQRHLPPLYCLPGRLVLTGDQLVDILRRQMAEKPETANLPFGLGLLTALKNLFPCPPEAGSN